MPMTIGQVKFLGKAILEIKKNAMARQKQI